MGVSDAAGGSTGRVRLVVESLVLVVLGFVFISVLKASRVPPDSERLRLRIGSAARIRGAYPVSLHPPMNLNFKTRPEIHALRSDAVAEHAGLAASGYSPAPAVFGAIEDRKPWWGLYGIYFHGRGDRSIEGDSEESRFILNPYMLVGVRETLAYAMGREPDASAAYYPMPQALEWRPDGATAAVRYDVADHFEFLRLNGYPRAAERQLELVAYNARDFGLNYLYIDPEKSTHVVPVGLPAQAVPIQQFIHCGGNCGYPGGCNNKSSINHLYVQIPELPAKAVIKLWRGKPFDVGSAADMTFVLDMF